MVAMMPSSSSFLMISAAGLPMRSDRSFTVIFSAVMYAFSILTGSGRACAAWLFLGFLLRRHSSSSPPAARTVSFMICFFCLGAFFSGSCWRL